MNPNSLKKFATALRTASDNLLTSLEKEENKPAKEPKTPKAAKAPATGGGEVLAGFQIKSAEGKFTLPSKDTIVDKAQEFGIAAAELAALTGPKKPSNDEKIRVLKLIDAVMKNGSGGQVAASPA